MPEEKGLIDDQLATLLLRFMEKTNSIQFDTHTTAPFDSLSQKEILIIERLGKRTLSMKELGIEVCVKNSTLTQITDRLVKKQYLRRAHGGSDRRVVNVELTDKGIGLHERQREAKRMAADSMLRSLRFEEQVAMLNALTKIMEKI